MKPVLSIPCGRRLAAGLLAAALLLAAGCRGPNVRMPVPAAPAPVPYEAGGAIDPAWLKPSDEPFRLGPGDRVAIEVSGEPSSRVETVVGPDGRIYYEMLAGLDVWGRTLGEARDALQTALTEFYRESPAVNLTLLEVRSKNVWVLGRVGSPGLYPLNGPTTLLDAISAAGGPASGQSVARLSTGGSITLANPRADAGDLERAFVVRDARPLPVSIRRLLQDGDMSQNIYLRPDDLVYLPSPAPSEIYVLGAVNNPRAVRLSGPPTLVSAIAGAGGTAEYGYLTDVAVVRGGVTEPSIAVYDYRQIVSGRAPDVRLEPNDIVFVPRAPYAVIGRYLDLIVTTFVRTVGVNAGARAANVETELNIAVPLGP
ncbi:MAG TPA: SLBB domain-containing protein [Opitutaceae bacterium]|nr:SLBB domain-containing protein [Opitutaceae bacterium]